MYKRFGDIYEKAPTKRNFGVNAHEVKELQLELRILIETVHQYNENYLWNVQGPFMEIEKQIIEDHKHKYPQYLELKKIEIERDKYVKEGEAKIRSLKYNIRELYKR